MKRWRLFLLSMRMRQQARMMRNMSERIADDLANYRALGLLHRDTRKERDALRVRIDPNPRVTVPKI